MEKEITNIIKLGSVVGTVPTTHSKKDIFNVLTNKYYAGILYLCCEKGYTYLKECDKCLGHIDCRGYINRLINLGILEETTLTKQQKEVIASINNLGEYHLTLLTPYKITAEFRAILNNAFYYDLMRENCDNYVLKFKEYLTKKYNSIVETKHLSEQHEQEKLYLRYKIAKQKAEMYRTADDWGVICIFENNY